MSRPTEKTITCRGCGWQQEFTAWDSVNVTRDPQRKGELVHGQLTRFVCEKCGWSSEVIYPLLYHDMKQQLLVWLVPPGNQVETGDLPFGRLMQDYRFRFVSNRNELVEKIFIFDAGLDDRVVECFKLILRAQSVQKSQPLKGSLFFIEVTSPEGEDRRICLEHLTPEGVQAVETPFAYFDQVQNSLAGRLPTNDAERGQWLTVNAAYAAALMKER